MKYWILFSVIIISTIFYCEFASHYFKLAQCSLPILRNGSDENSLSAMLLADTHLLGPFRGHWLDKLYREWHMRRSFQAAMTLLKPELVFVLGDLFDEGDLVDNKYFEHYVNRFHKHFRTPENVQLFAIVGNHDIGFHYKLRKYLTDRFDNNFNNTGIQLYTIKDVNFVMINSMAMENDGCYFCDTAQQSLHQISRIIKNSTKYSRPIIMQHFPTYRPSDKYCLEYDTPIIENFRETWEVLSQSSTQLLDDLLKPRLAFAGHSHHYCRSINMMEIEEFTVASFSWRNKKNPSFLLAQFSTTDYIVNKCDMVQQQAIFNIYFIAIIVCLLIILHKIVKKLCNRNKVD